MSQLVKKRTPIRAYTEFPFNKRRGQVKENIIITSPKLKFRKKIINTINGFTTGSYKIFPPRHACKVQQQPPTHASLGS